MKVLTQLQNPELLAALEAGEVAVIKTDTLYGLVASAHSSEAVEQVYALKQRDPAKACIVLIADTSQLLPGTKLDEAHQALCRQYWPGPVTIVLPVDAAAPLFVHRGVGSIAYRCPADPELRQLLSRTGPLVAPSANPESLPPARTIHDAQQYFGEHVAMYVDGGTIEDDVAPSRIVTLDSGGQEVFLR